MARSDGTRLYKRSIRFRIIFLVIIITVVALSVAWAICNLFIEQFFVLRAKANLSRTYESCNLFFQNEQNVRYLETNGFGDLYGYVENPAAASIFVIDPESFEVYSSAVVNKTVAKGLASLIQNTDFEELSRNGQKYEIKMHSSEADKTTYNPSASGDNKLGDNKLLNASMYDLVGVLDNGYIIILRSHVSMVRTSVVFSSRLFIIFSSGLIILETLALLIIMNNFTVPIIHMSKAAKKMARGEFDTRVVVASDDEIGELGNSMNEMSAALESTITELKNANNQLAKDIEKKERMEMMRSEFLSHVSHELKTPIALIQGYAEGLKDSVNDDPESMDFYCDVIIDEANKMNLLVRQLLNLNELEFGMNKTSIERFDVTELVKNVVSANTISAEQKNAKITIEWDEPVYIWADIFMMEQVITNYLTNAIHYVTEAGNIRIWKEMRDDIVRIHVFNEGDAIADKDIDKLFIKFYKADAARTREYGGSGIGLSIVAAIMNAHNKEYGVSNVENGVDFYFDADSNRAGNPSEEEL